MPTLRISCSPDADDLFMVRALLEGRIDTGHYAFEIGTSPTDALNRIAAGEDAPEVIAISTAHYPAIADRYQLLPHGGSLGEGYGPVVVAPSGRSLKELVARPGRIGVPGLTTTAWLVLRMILGSATTAEPVVVPIEPYSKIFDALRAGDIDAGLVIHEGRLTFEDEGMVSIVDLGAWWAEQTGGLPLPLGANAIRRSLGEEIVRDVSALLKASIAHGLDHRDEAIDWLLSRNGPLKTPERVSEYLGMYANARTLDYGEAGRKGVEALFARAATAGLLPAIGAVDWAPAP